MTPLRLAGKEFGPEGIRIDYGRRDLAKKEDAR
jgi:hypothetical protein